MAGPIPAPVQAKLPRAGAACEACGVRRLWVFGSAARGDSREGHGDIALLVELDPRQPLPGQFVALSRALGENLHQRVDIAGIGGVRNPIFRAELEATRVPVYAAA